MVYDTMSGILIQAVSVTTLHQKHVITSARSGRFIQPFPLHAQTMGRCIAFPVRKCSRPVSLGSWVTARSNLPSFVLLSWSLQEGAGVDSSEGWTCKAPLRAGAKATAMVNVSFAPHQACATSKSRSVERSAQLTLPPMSRCRATAGYMSSLVAVDAVLTVRKTYTNGATYTREVPAKYTGVSGDDAEIELESMPYGSLKRNRQSS